MPFKGKHHRDLSVISVVDWARLAAYIDGEGCISIKSVKGYHAASRRVFYVNVSVCNTDFRLLKWLQEVFGGSVSVRKVPVKTPHWAASALWTVGSKYAVDILKGCSPFFIIKSEQAQVAIDFQDTVFPDRRFGRSGRPKEALAHQEWLKKLLTDLKTTSGRTTQPKAVDTPIQ